MKCEECNAYGDANGVKFFAPCQAWLCGYHRWQYGGSVA